MYPVLACVLERVGEGGVTCLRLRVLKLTELKGEGRDYMSCACVACVCFSMNNWEGRNFMSCVCVCLMLTTKGHPRYVATRALLRGGP